MRYCPIQTNKRASACQPQHSWVPHGECSHFCPLRSRQMVCHQTGTPKDAVHNLHVVRPHVLLPIDPSQGEEVHLWLVWKEDLRVESRVLSTDETRLEESHRHLWPRDWKSTRDQSAVRKGEGLLLGKLEKAWGIEHVDSCLYYGVILLFKTDWLPLILSLYLFLLNYLYLT